ncbi:MAG: hypothetical protein COT88_01010 [Candidatus Colwellbacteria bacterium CG10_big_fil_rev_8_21_14_0_10_41_28]|uniref:Uncharacterized protein n=1 Tax=Candidatus Colwellbacteria bacterium CG10_big_fil_rev_8_21_14_0_10_41_28 TaxID=1974539 RepID=A0A2H0VHF3_9BACT|nr:MAG: hypothetical protein COT88_01010 [Candidatus Colwellbacteria bacterium CG10_big_fil_rev_8_21_14_0_10_41_28]
METNLPEQFNPQLEALGSEVNRRVETGGVQKYGEEPHKAALKEVVADKMAQAIQPVGAQNVSDNSLTDEHQRILDSLVKVAVQDDLDKAIGEIKKMELPALIDLFHDRVTTDLYDQLVQSQKLKKLDR